MRIKGSTVQTDGGDVVGRDKVLGDKVHIEKLILGSPEQPRVRVPMMAPEPPDDFVQRPAEFGALKNQLLNSDGKTIAITAALRGAGGYGKTTLAKALAHDPDIRKTFRGGILWITLGEKPESLLLIISDLITLLTGAQPGLNTISAASSALSEALGNRRILLVIDDVWREQDLRPFMQGGPNTKRLVTTRNDSTLPTNVSCQCVDAMGDTEALELLAKGLQAPTSQQRELMALAARLGEWPLLLKLVNGFLRDRVIKLKQRLSVAIAAVNKRLDENGLIAFDARSETERSKAVALTIGASLDLLPISSRDRFAEFGIFPEDAHIPILVVENLWRDQLNEIETENLLSEFYRLSLLLDLDLDRRTLQMHDIIRHFLRSQTGGDGLVTLQRRLIRTLDEIRAPEKDDFTKHYYYLQLPYHLFEANERERLDSLLLDPSWLTTKLKATANTSALVADYDHYAHGESQKVIGQALRLVAGICARDPKQLIPQLLARLMTNEAVIESGFLNTARTCLNLPAILEQYPVLTPPGTEVTRLEGSHAVTALCVLPSGRLASGFSDGTIRVWDVARGVEVTCLKGDWYLEVTALCVLPDGRLASSHSDRTLRLWDVAREAEVARLEVQRDEVYDDDDDDDDDYVGVDTALCVLPDGRLASGFKEGVFVENRKLQRLVPTYHTIQLFDVGCSTEVARLEGHEAAVTALCVLRDGRLASAFSDGTIRLWDVARESEVARLEGHNSGVSALCVLPDGRLASGSDDDGTIRLWDVARGAQVARLNGPQNKVTALCVLPDGRLASGSRDEGTIQLWDVARGAEVARLEGHTLMIHTLCMLPDGRLASGSQDRTIRLWDVEHKAEIGRLEGHQKEVSELCVLRDGRLASASHDKSIRLWDTKVRAEIARLDEHADWRTSLCELRDGRLVSGSDTDPIRLWDTAQGIEVTRFKGPSNGVSALCELRDGRLVSGSSDGSIQLWDVAREVEVGRLQGHGRVGVLCELRDGRLVSTSGYTIQLWDVRREVEVARLQIKNGIADVIKALCELPDSRLAAGSFYGTEIWLWDAACGAEVGRLLGHNGGVCALCVLPNGRLVSASYDKTIRLWDTTGQFEISRLEIDAPVHSLIALSSDGHLVAGDLLGRLHWLQVVDNAKAVG